MPLCDLDFSDWRWVSVADAVTTPHTNLETEHMVLLYTVFLLIIPIPLIPNRTILFSFLIFLALAFFCSHLSLNALLHWHMSKFLDQPYVTSLLTKHTHQMRFFEKFFTSEAGTPISH